MKSVPMRTNWCPRMKSYPLNESCVPYESDSALPRRHLASGAAIDHDVRLPSVESSDELEEQGRCKERRQHEAIDVDYVVEKVQQEDERRGYHHLQIHDVLQIAQELDPSNVDDHEPRHLDRGQWHHNL